MHNDSIKQEHAFYESANSKTVKNQKVWVIEKKYDKQLEQLKEDYNEKLNHIIKNIENYKDEILRDPEKFKEFMRNSDIIIYR